MPTSSLSTSSLWRLSDLFRSTWLSTRLWASTSSPTLSIDASGTSVISTLRSPATLSQGTSIIFKDSDNVNYPSINISSTINAVQCIDTAIVTEDLSQVLLCSTQCTFTPSGQLSSSPVMLLSPSPSSALPFAPSARASLHARSIHTSQQLPTPFSNNPSKQPMYVFNHAAAGYPKNSLSPVGTSPSFAPTGSSVASKTAGNSTSAVSLKQSPKTHLKATSCGEDAFFSRFNALGVSDGVGGWSGHENADPALYSRTIMHYCNIEVEKLDISHSSNTSSSSTSSLVNSTWQPRLQSTPGSPQSPLQPAVSKRQAHTVAASTHTDGVGLSTIIDYLYDPIYTPLQGVVNTGVKYHSSISSLPLPDPPTSIVYGAVSVGKLNPTHLTTVLKTSLTVESEEKDSSTILDGNSNTTPIIAVKSGGNGSGNDQRHSQATAEPVQIMQLAYDKSVQDTAAQGIVGSTTACLVVLHYDELRISNLGDCGVLIIRKDDFAFRTEEQVHSFNYPYQLGTASDDRPADAQNFTVRVHRGDIVIVASDGVFDNVFDDEILDIVNKHTRSLGISGWNPAKLSMAIATRAKEVSEDGRCASPFQSRALAEGLYYQGGKQDDITVVVAVVRDYGDLAKQNMTSIV